MKAREREYLFERAPSFKKWINTCASCGLQGYKPDMRPEYFFAGSGAQAIKKLFDELALDRFGLCPACSALYKKQE
jgi:hypothetical protein